MELNDDGEERGKGVFPARLEEEREVSEVGGKDLLECSRRSIRAWEDE